MMRAENGRRVVGLNEETMRAHGLTVTGLQEKVDTLELKWTTSEKTKAALVGKHSALTKRCQLLETQVDAAQHGGGGEQVRRQRAVETDDKSSKSDLAELFVRLW